MKSYEDEETFFSALASTRRLEILKCISLGIDNPKEIAEKLNAHRSAIEKHLSILKTAGIIWKVPSLNQKGHLSVRYATKVPISEILEAFQKVKGLL